MDLWLALLGAAGVSLLSAITQVVPVEAYLAGAAALGGTAHLWLVSAAAGLAHGLGKIGWYEVGRSAHGWDRFRRFMERPTVARTYARWLKALERRPRAVLLMLLVSSLTSVPPLWVTPTLAGQLHASRTGMVLMVTLGRTVRYAALLGAVDGLRQLF